MSISFHFKSMTFSDGTTIKLNPDDIIVLVGPNNCGKTEALRALHHHVIHSYTQSPVVVKVEYVKAGSSDDLIKWMDSHCNQIMQGDQNHYTRLGASIPPENAIALWGADRLRGLGNFFVNRAQTEHRLLAANPAPNIRLLHDAFSHPIHYLQDDDAIEDRFSKRFRKAFGKDIVVHRNAGSEVPLYCGQRPEISEGEDRLSKSWLRQVEKMEKLAEQGDGMRSFAGTLLHATVAEFFALLIDEPEAFLHPPQSKHIGQMLANDKTKGGQLILATHSGDFLRGLLSADKGNVRVIRIRREENVNHAKQLDATQVKALWSDPLLRYSNLLDGVFHEKVVVCEADSDCQFYDAILDAVCDTNEELQKPDLKFTHSGGKDRLPLVVESLRALDVPVAVVADFDVLRDKPLLQKLVNHQGGDWQEIESLWKTVKDAIDNKKPNLKSANVKKAIAKILDEITDDVFPDEKAKKIRALFKQTTSWGIAKQQGIHWVPFGQPRITAKKLLESLKSLGIFVVPDGEMESFCPTAGGHGPSFVANVLEKDLANDPELDEARKFVSTLL